LCTIRLKKFTEKYQYIYVGGAFKGTIYNVPGNMELKGRLGSIAKKVPKCNIVCDIGTDHVYIPICLLKTGICKRAVVTDINEGPVARAQKNIKEYHLEEYIEARVGDGLEPIKDNEIDVIIIAGMGGKLIAKILGEGITKAKRARLLVLQPMNSEELVSAWLYENGFEILDEELIKEGNKIYNIKVAKWTGKLKAYNEIEIYLSEKLISKKSPVLEEYISKKITMLNKKISGMKLSKSIDIIELQKYISLKGGILEVLKQIKQKNVVEGGCK